MALSDNEIHATAVDIVIEHLKNLPFRVVYECPSCADIIDDDELAEIHDHAGMILARMVTRMRDGMAVEVTTCIAPENHDYLSTSCHHGIETPDLHARCRRECKWCFTPCRCRCHGKAA